MHARAELQGRTIMATACGEYLVTHRRRFLQLALYGLAAAPIGGAAHAATVDDLVAQGQYCSATAQALYQACGHQTQDDYLVNVAICINEPEAADRAECFEDARDTRSEDSQLCR